MKGAKSISGLKGNLRFIIGYKMWATAIVFIAGFILGTAFGGTIVNLVVGEAQAAECNSERAACIYEAVRALDQSNDSLWTKAGKPKARALSAATGLRVSADERDAVWARYNEQQAIESEAGFSQATLEDAEKRAKAAEDRSSDLAMRLEEARTERSRWRLSSRDLASKNKALARRMEVLENKYQAVASGEKPCIGQIAVVKDELEDWVFDKKTARNLLACLEAGE